MSRRVLITRCAEDCVELEKLLAGAEISIVPYPVLRFEAIKSTKSWKNLLALLSEGRAEAMERWLLLASPRAARPLAEQISGFGAATLLVFKLATVGKTTARAAQQRGFRVSLTGKGTGAALAAELLARLDQPALFVFACGEDHRKELPEALMQAGHEVMLLPVYRMLRLPPAPLPEGRIDAVVLTSPRSARYYLENLGGHPPRCPHIALGPTTASAWRRLGFECSIPPRPEMDSLAEALRGL